jgi:DNA replicative helicase MCM subunit Mcm2 (Cdc46/Mcm family)
MEPQQVSIAKAGVVASFSAKCSVIAAANPKDGNYDTKRSIIENLNITKPILSQFDLVFIIRDRADKVHDGVVSSAIIKSYQKGKLDDIGSTKIQTPVAKTGREKKFEF